jgi:predicted nuclease with TOPRIM domain
MTIVTENDLQEVKDLIAQLSHCINSQNEQVNQKLNHLTVEVAVIKESLNGVNKRMDDFNKRMDDLNKRIDDTNTRIGSIDLLIRVIVGGVGVAIVVGLIKFLFSDVTI